jgi:hypothetical protein
MRDKVLRWFMFGVLISLLPLAYTYENLVIKSQPVDMAKVVGNGELLIIVWALCAGAIGELFGSTADYKWFKIVSGGLTLIVLIMSALLFASIAEARVEHTAVNDVEIVWNSKILFLFGIVSCASCLVLSELKE